MAATTGADYHELDSEVVVDLFWALADPESGIEHVHACTRPGRIELIFFSLAPDADSAAEAGTRLCVLATTTAPQFHGWRVLPA